jgi:chemotaxis protein methyltransferase CheR
MNNHHHIKALEQSLAARFGWQTNSSWRDSLIAAVGRKAQRLGFEEEAYCRMATASAGELEALAEMITNGETRFFREPEQFAALGESVLPEIIRLRSKEKKIDIWSAACSTGEEPYSLAILLSESLLEGERWKTKMLATDLRASAIMKASRGSYAASSLRLLGKSIRSRYFTRAETNGREHDYEASPDLKKMISFRRANIYDLKFWESFRHEFDLILCNNLLVYFHALAVKQTVDRLARCLKTSGVLMVMGSEASYVHHPRLKADAHLPAGFFRKI